MYRAKNAAWNVAKEVRHGKEFVTGLDTLSHLAEKWTVPNLSPSPHNKMLYSLPESADDPSTLFSQLVTAAKNQFSLALSEQWQETLPEELRWRVVYAHINLQKLLLPMANYLAEGEYGNSLTVQFSGKDSYALSVDGVPTSEKTQLQVTHSYADTLEALQPNMEGDLETQAKELRRVLLLLESLDAARNATRSFRLHRGKSHCWIVVWFY